MNGHWRVAAFEEIIRARGSGSSGLPKSEWKDAGKFPVIGQGAPQIEGWTDRSDLVIESAKPLVLYGGHTRRAKIVACPFVPGPNVRILEPKDGLDARFLFHFLSQLEIDEKGYADHFPLVRRCDVPLPPVGEQKRIVTVLDQAFAALDRARTNAEANLVDARSLFDSALRERLNDIAVVEPQVSLAEMCIAIVDCEHKTAPVSETGYPSIRTPNIGKGVLSMEDVYRVSELTYREWTKRAVPEAGDLIMAREAPAGNVAVIPHGERVCLGQRTLLIKPDSNTTFGPFLAHLLLHPVLQERLLSKSSGATVQHVNMKDIRLLPMPKLPTIQTQRQLMGVLDSVRGVADELAQRAARKLADIAALRQSLLQAAFSGQLT